jgi:outer membrane protein OmpA-like peptidoglycan-associated protein
LYAGESSGYPSNTLSQGRAETVRNYLVEVAPELATKLSAHGYGPSMPVADNGTKDGRQMNRRVSLRVLNKEELRSYTLN